MASRLAGYGFKVVCCTPHCIKGYYDITVQRVREATLMLQADLDQAGINLELWPGMEYMLDECFAEHAGHLLPLGSTGLILCEAPQEGDPERVVTNLQLIIDRGYVPLLAHPERTPSLYQSFVSSRLGTETDQVDRMSWFKKLLGPNARPNKFSDAEMARADCLPKLPKQVCFQANLGAFTGYYGTSVQRRSYELLKMGIYRALASDLHDAAAADLVLDPGKVENNPLLQKLVAASQMIGAKFQGGH
ncbi:MAG: hypothetical protein C0614_03700 [Desulfuromonas sp.]|nr:MAG: hypothetical protein C0614_03700 [Desulfuromonas sp.]